MWWWDAKTRTAIVESARVVGLAMLPPGKFHPFQLDTFGLGAVLQAAARKGARQIIVGIGGSATNDGGFGLARALGWRFLDTQDGEIESWTGLSALATIRPPKQRKLPEIIVAVDVQNKLLGPRGATHIYGPQK
jgi:glycerate kinase